MTLKDFLGIICPITTENGATEMRPKIICADGFNMSVQASQYHYSRPRVANAREYNAIECASPSDENVPEIIDYAESPNIPTCSVYGYVPIENVEKLIENHGGLDVDAMIKWTTTHYALRTDLPFTAGYFAHEMKKFL